MELGTGGIGVVGADGLPFQFGAVLEHLVVRVRVLPVLGAIAGGVLIPSIPLALLYNAFLNRFIAGFTGGAFR